MNNYCTYLRVSTQRQGAQGLGISSQRGICEEFIRQHNGTLVQEFMDVESGTHRDRKGLWSAIEYCQKNKIPLVIATLSRLARDVEFCFKVINTGIEIHFCDMPQINTLLLGVFASVAQYERELTSDRTRKALAAKKARGEKTGGACDKWREAFNNKPKEQKREECMKKGQLKNERHLQKKEVQVMLKIIKSVFPDACQSDDATTWDWTQVNTKGENKTRMFKMMQDYRDLDESGLLFRKWNFDDDIIKLQIKLATSIQSIRRSVLYKERVENECKRGWR